MITEKDEMLIIAESALRKINQVSKDAYSSKTPLSPSMITYMAEFALAKIARIKQRTR